MKTTAFVIHLERAVHRQQHVERLLAGCPWPCGVVPAVDGARLTPRQIQAAYQRRLHVPTFPLSMRPGEIGCFLSHRRVWQIIVDEGIDFALVLEDDVELALPAFAASLDYAEAHIRPGDYVQFQVRDIGTRHPTLRTDGRHTLLQPLVTPLRTTAQLVTRQAAHRLLAASAPFDRPVDSLLQMRWLTGVPVSVVVPSCVSEVSREIGGSTLAAGHKSIGLWIRRKVLRPIYHRRIALLSRRHAEIAA